MTVPAPTPTPTPFIVISTGHRLLPFAYRLQNEGHKVQVAMVHVSDAWYSAWGGKFDSFLRLPKRDSFQEDKAAQILEAATLSGAIILTDSLVWGNYFRLHNEHVTIYSTHDTHTPSGWGQLCLGWFQGPAGATLPHILFQKTSLWPGDLGPNRVPVAGTAKFTSAPWVQELVTDTRRELVPDDYIGLVQVPLQWEDGGIHTQPPAIRMGWNFLQSHLLVGDLPNFGALLDGTDTDPDLGDRYVCGVTVSIPPWPLKCSLKAREAVISGIPPEATKDFFFHDMRLVDGQLMTVGLDGLVAVARGSANSLTLASAMALQRASMIALPEKQFRPDAFQGVDGIVGMMEAQGLEI